MNVTVPHAETHSKEEILTVKVLLWSYTVCLIYDQQIDVQEDS